MQIAGEETLGAWSSLLRAHRRLTGLLDEQLRAATGLTLDDYDVLYQLRRAGGPLRMTDLAARVLISRPAVSRLVDRLVAEAWVSRHHDEVDRRVVLLQLTGEGRRVQGRAARVHLAGIERLVGSPLAGHDIAAVTAALRVLAGDAPP